MRYKNRRYDNVVCLESTAVVVSGTIMQINIIPLQAFTNYKFYGLDVCLSFPQNTGVETVSLNDGTNDYPLMDTNGQPVVSSRLRGHSRYRVRFGAGGALSSGSIPAHFTVYSELCPVKYSSNAAYQAVPTQEV